MVIQHQPRAPYMGRVPYFELKTLECSKYARVAAERLFGYLYCSAPAWDLRYLNREVWARQTAGSTDWSDVVEPGFLLGIYWPGSMMNTSHCGERDKQDRDRAFTHVALWIGNGMMAHQFIDNVRKDPVVDFLFERDMRLESIIAPPHETL